MECRIEEAIKTIKMNDRGGFTVPTNRLYHYPVSYTHLRAHET